MKNQTFATLLATATLLLPGLLLLAPTATAGGPGRILVLEGYQSGLSPALTAVGFPTCGNQPHACHVVVTPAQLSAFTPFDYQPYSMVVTGLWLSTQSLNALSTQQLNLDQFVTNDGGSLVTFASGGFAWIPGGGLTSAANTGDDVVLTPYGATHPAFGALSAAQLSNWGSSSHYEFSAWPSYMQPLARDTNGNEIVLGGHRGNGCVLLSGIDADWHAAHDPSSTDRGNARSYLHAAIDWAYNCDCGKGKPCESSIMLTGKRDGIYERRAGLEGDADRDIDPTGLLTTTLDSLTSVAPYRPEGAYRGPVKVNVQACHCLITGVTFDYTLHTDDGIPDFMFPTHTQTVNKPEWTVTPPPDGDTYRVKVTVTLDCFDEGQKTLVKEFLLRA